MQVHVPSGGGDWSEIKMISAGVNADLQCRFEC